MARVGCVPGAADPKDKGGLQEVCLGKSDMERVSQEHVCRVFMSPSGAEGSREEAGRAVRPSADPGSLEPLCLLSQLGSGGLLLQGVLGDRSSHCSPTLSFLTRHLTGIDYKGRPRPGWEQARLHPGPLNLHA